MTDSSQKPTLTSNEKPTRDEWTMKGELSLRGPNYSPMPFESRWVRAEWADAEIGRLQAKVDALMLEYCPSEMTDAQREEWAKHQHPRNETRAVVPETLVVWVAADYWRCSCKSPGDINHGNSWQCRDCGTIRPEKVPAQKASEQLCPKCEQPMAFHMSNGAGTIVNQCPTMIEAPESEEV